MQFRNSSFFSEALISKHNMSVTQGSGAAARVAGNVAAGKGLVWLVLKRCPAFF